MNLKYSSNCSRILEQTCASGSVALSGFHDLGFEYSLCSFLKLASGRCRARVLRAGQPGARIAGELAFDVKLLELRSLADALGRGDGEGDAGDEMKIN
jgi:hypothetical protein